MSCPAYDCSGHLLNKRITNPEEIDLPVDVWEQINHKPVFHCVYCGFLWHEDSVGFPPYMTVRPIGYQDNANKGAGHYVPAPHERLKTRKT